MTYRKASVYPSRSAFGRIEPTLLVAHTTEGYGRTYLDQLFSGQIKRDGKQSISVHWCIYRNGDIVEYTPWKRGEALKCIHAGASTWKGRNSCNGFSLGYEIEHVQGDPYPEAVIRSVLELNAMVKAEYPDIELVHHYDIAPGRKIDPTPPWKTDVLPRVLAAWEDDMTDTQAALLTEAVDLLREIAGLERQGRISDIARSYEYLILEAMLLGDTTLAAALRTEREEKMKAERAKLRA
jgi:N-acetyl-anhydromuramyl-L-alanine amidase AmpD